MTIKLKNLGTINKNELDISNGDGDYITIDFSYETPIAFAGRIKDVTVNCVRENDWGPTTGKFINKISRKEERVTGKVFEEKLEEVLSIFDFQSSWNKSK